MGAFVFIIWIILSFIIAGAGSERKVGFWLTLFTCLILSPLIGIIVVAFSEKKPKKVSNSEKAIEVLKSYKDKLDLDLITQEEYDAKKEELSKHIK